MYQLSFVEHKRILSNLNFWTEVCFYKITTRVWQNIKNTLWYLHSTAVCHQYLFVLGWSAIGQWCQVCCAWVWWF